MIKVFALVALLSTGLWHEEVHYYHSSDGNTEMTFGGIQFKQKPGEPLRLIIDGGIHITSKKDQLAIFADHATTLFDNQGGATTLKSVHAEKNVRLIKDEGTKRVSTISSNRADYRISAGTSSADFNGSVVLTDVNSDKRTTVKATGSHGHADFLGGVQSKSTTMKEAELMGSVVVNVDQTGFSGSKPGKLVIHCSKLTYTPSGKTAVLVLSGHVQIQGNGGAVNGTMGGVENVTVHLEEGQASEVSAG